MIGRPFRVDWHPEDTPEALRAVYRAQQDTMLRTRLHALWLLRSGRRMGEVASMVALPTVVQSGYSPELNPAERVFEEVRRWAEGRIYGSIEEKVEAANAYLRRLESDPRRVRSLPGWDWIDEAIESRPSSYAASSD